MLDWRGAHLKKASLSENQPPATAAVVSADLPARNHAAQTVLATAEEFLVNASGNPDIQRVQRAAWGQLGYTPSD